VNIREYSSSKRIRFEFEIDVEVKFEFEIDVEVKFEFEFGSTKFSPISKIRIRQIFANSNSNFSNIRTPLILIVVSS
jgi:hypothetical protein